VTAPKLPPATWLPNESPADKWARVKASLVDLPPPTDEQRAAFQSDPHAMAYAAAVLARAEDPSLPRPASRCGNCPGDGRCPRCTYGSVTEDGVTYVCAECDGDGRCIVCGDPADRERLGIPV